MWRPCSVEQKNELCLCTLNRIDYYEILYRILLYSPNNVLLKIVVHREKMQICISFAFHLWIKELKNYFSTHLGCGIHADLIFNELLSVKIIDVFLFDIVFASDALNMDNKPANKKICSFVKQTFSNYFGKFSFLLALCSGVFQWNSLRSHPQKQSRIYSKFENNIFHLKSSPFCVLTRRTKVLWLILKVLFACVHIKNKHTRLSKKRFWCYAHTHLCTHEVFDTRREEGKSENAKILNALHTLSLLPAAGAQNKARSHVINYHTLEAKISLDLWRRAQEMLFLPHRVPFVLWQLC